MRQNRTGTVEVFGFGNCSRCGLLVEREVLNHLSGCCTQCYRVHRDEVLMRVDGAPVVFAPTKKKRSKADKGKESEAAKRHRTEGDNASERARRRFASDFGPLYATYLAEERLASGLNPWTPQMLALYDDPAVTLEKLATYHARRTRGEAHGTASTTSAVPE